MRTGGDEASERPTPCPSHGPLKHPRATSVARKAHYYGGPRRRAFSAEGDTGQTFQLYRNNPTTDLVRHISAQGINMTTPKERLKSSSVFMISTSLCRSESKKRGCHITADSESSPPMHPTPFSEGILEHEFLKKFMILTFDYYFGQSDLVQHLRQY